MAKQIFIGLYTEGNTDKRFLESVVKRVFDETAFEAVGDFETYIHPIECLNNGLSFTEQIIHVAQKGTAEFGITVLCIHKDADSPDDENVLNHSIQPALDALAEKDESDYCKIITLIIPVRMIEAWLLADKELFKKEISTTKSNTELGINRFPEQMADPKNVIKEAIRIARQGVVKRRRHDLTIANIYMPLGQKISTTSLNSLASFAKFRESVRAAFRTLNYLH